MKKQILAVGLSLSFLNCLSQDKDTFQSDSIYKLNKVKSRTQINVGAYTKQTNIIKYEKTGRISEYILTDESGVKPQNRTVYKYDANGKLITEDYFYGSIEGEKTKIEYDATNRVIKKSTTYYDNKPKNEIQITYDPLVEFEKQFNREGKLQSEYYNHYEKSNVTSRFTGTNFRPNGQKESSWDYRHKNTFDSEGRLLKRESKQGKQTIQLMEYEYNDKGLLIRKTIKSDFAPPILEEYKYEFWQ
jgi:hypothetical protein